MEKSFRHGLIRRKSRTKICHDHRSVNEQQVEDITLDLFYKPHTLSLLAFLLVGLLYVACTRSNADPYQNISYGIVAVIAVLIGPLSLILFPNCTFIRPHPACWRMVFGASLVYFLSLVFMLFLNMEQVRSLMIYIDPSLEHAKREIDTVESYASNCSDFSLQTLYEALDIFAFAHFWGWGMKALMLRNYGICWTLSITWEMTEVQFTHLLPNFKECWWDQWILDVLICNGGGIWLGMQVAKFLEMRTYRWESILKLDNKSAKVKRALLQFTPSSWTKLDWFEKENPFTRCCALFFLMIMWQIAELNTFFGKHYFRYPAKHWLCWGRMLFMGPVSAPAIKQYYSYATDTRCKRLGNHAWLFIAIVMLELIVNIKFGFEEFSNANQVLIFQWVIIMLCGSLCGLLICYWSGLIKQKIAPLKYSTFDASADESEDLFIDNFDKQK